MPTHTLAGQARALLLPGAGLAYVQTVQHNSFITMLVHDVKDLAGVYAGIEHGLCTGLTKRLDHLTNARAQINATALMSAQYSLPNKNEHHARDPGRVYYRRLANTGKCSGDSRSVIIPFYSAFVEDDSEGASGPRKRLMETPLDKLTRDDALSFHSSIPANAEHSRLAVACDVAFGQAGSIDDEGVYACLRRIAVWRLDCGEKKNRQHAPCAGIADEVAIDRTFGGDGCDKDTLAFYKTEEPGNRALIYATTDYRATGKPDKYRRYINRRLPTLIWSEARG